MKKRYYVISDDAELVSCADTAEAAIADAQEELTDGCELVMTIKVFEEPQPKGKWKDIT